jgi:hypothetical protein
VQKELKAYAFAAKARGDVALTAHRLTGSTRLVVRKGNHLDWWLILDDSRGQNAAMAIEYGRAAVIDRDTYEVQAAVPGLFILHKAMGLPHDESSFRIKMEPD